MRTTLVRHPDDMPSRAPGTWQEIAALAQQSLAQVLPAVIADGRLDRRRYQHWLAMESAVERIGALVLERVADWHCGQPALRATALGWATSLREDALAAAADVRALDGFAPPPPAQLARWHAYVEDACHSPRAGEALGTVLLHSRLLQGAARPAVDLALELPFIAQRGRTWLLRRRESEPGDVPEDRLALLAAWPGASLATGAQRAATWHRNALAAVAGLADS